MDMFVAKCEFIISVTKHEKIRALVRSILDWHEFDSFSYPTSAQRFLVEKFWRTYSTRAEEPREIETFEA